MSAAIMKGDAVQVLIGRRLVDGRAESGVYVGRMPGDWYDRELIDYSHQASPADRHRCTGAAYLFERVQP